MMTEPTKIDRKWKLKDGIELEITGPYKNRDLDGLTDDPVDTMLLAARFTTPTFKGPFYKAVLKREPKEKHPEKKVVFCETRKGLMGLVRLEVAKFRNPELGKMIRKLEGKADMSSFDEMMRQYLPAELIKQQMMQANSLMSQIAKQQKQLGQPLITVPLQAGIGKSGMIRAQQSGIQARAQALQQKAAAMQARHDAMNHHLDAMKYAMMQAPIPQIFGLFDEPAKPEPKPKKKKKWKFW